MVCKHCNTQNIDDAKYCGRCGKELSGIYCPRCDTHNDDGSVFCKACGARLDGKRFCLQCGRELAQDMVFCTACGMKYDEGSTENGQSKSKNKPDLVEASGKFTKAMRTTSLGISIGLAVLAIIFTIFMGATVKSSLGNLGSIFEGAEGIRTFSFLDFFGNAWEYLGDIRESVGDSYSALISMHCVQVIFGFAICLATLTAVLFFGIKGIIKSIKALKGGEGSGFVDAFAAFLAFACGSTALVMLSAYSVNVSTSGIAVNIRVGFDTATTVGIALGGVLAGLCGIAAVLANGEKQRHNREFIVKGSLSLYALLVGAIFVGLCVLPFVNMSTKTLIGDYYNTNVNAGTSYFLYIFEAASILDSTRYSYSSDSLKAIVLGTLAFAVLCYVLVRMICYIISLMGDVTSGDGKKAKGSLARSIEIFVATCVLLVLTIISFNCYMNTVSDGLDYYYGFGPLIGLTVLAGVNMGIEIARKVANKKYFDGERSVERSSAQ